MDRIPILLDTDIGSDIDDAVALAYLLRQPACELLGITTVSGEPARRASLADAVCQAGGRTEVPIHVGVENPLIVAQRQPRATQAEALSDAMPHRLFAQANTAIAFLRDTIRSRPGEITLLTIGPLTNIALLFALDPELPGMLKQLVMMGGRYHTRAANGGLAEWNILCDPHAAAMVFDAPVPRLVAVGLDVTEPCRLPREECRTRFTAAGGPLAPVVSMAEVWFRHVPHITFHDPLAAALIFKPSLCALEPYRIAVDLTNPYLSGLTLPLPGDTKPHLVAARVDPDAFFAHYFGIVGAG